MRRCPCLARRRGGGRVWTAGVAELAGGGRATAPVYSSLSIRTFNFMSGWRYEH